MNKINNAATEPEASDDDTVKAQYWCPCCGENRADSLIWDKARKKITCAFCGTEYKP